MKSKVNKGVIIAVSCLAALLIGVAWFYHNIFDSDKGYFFCMDMCSDGWEDYLTYKMLSRELRNIISEEEFTDETPEGKLKMYEKLNNLVLDERPYNSFEGSTRWGKTPCFETIEVDGTRYWAEFGIDITCTFGRIEVRNFTCYLHEM
ncbi:MAG: hypothetical protein HDR72_01645 [Ruminococcaceae bacterium]|nr:hypothetical protein [Oscillospiraceae bacterium]